MTFIDGFRRKAGKDWWIFATIASANAIVGGFIFLLEWRWFVLPLGARPITFPQAAGMWIVCRFLARGRPSGEETWREHFEDACAYWLALLFPTWVLHYFV